MDERHEVLAELEEARERAAGLLRAKLDAVAGHIREAAARAASELEVVVPPDLEILLPLAPVTRLLEAPPPPPAPTVALETVRRLDEGRAQSEVLKAFLGELEGLCGGRAILVFREGEVLGWHAVGMADDAAVRSWRARLDASAAFSAVAAGKPVLVESAADEVLASLVGASQRALLLPMSLRGKVVGAALALEANGTLATEAIQLLTYLAGLLLETLTVRPVVPTPVLGEPEILGAAPPVGGEAEVPFPTAEPMLEEVDTIGAEAVEAPAAAVPPPVKAPPVEAPPAEAVAVAPAAAAAPRTPEEEQKHSEAQRFARLLVSEIRLYNEQAVQEGRASRDIYQRLKEDIDRSREMYEQRVPADVRATSNYFFEELVRILADGDPDALGV